jgi:CBS domain-containing protein
MMHKGVECVSPDTAINAIAKRMRELDVGAIPVAADGKLVGMVTDRDIAIRAWPTARTYQRSTPRT